MSRTMIVGYDGSKTARAALAWAARRAGDGGRVTALHAIRVPSEFVETPYAERSLEHARQRAEEVLAELERDPPGAMNVDARTADGPPAQVLAEAARQAGADEIAVGSRGFGSLRATALGSTSHALLHEARLPVLVVTQRAAEREDGGGAEGAGPSGVVVGYDGSGCSHAALDYAKDTAADRGERLVAVSAFDAPSDWLGAPFYQRALDQHQARGRELLAELEQQPGNDSIETDLVEGPPAEALARVAQARDAALIVVGSRGLGRFRGALGSVSHALVHEAACPVVVVPPPSGD